MRWLPALVPLLSLVPLGSAGAAFNTGAELRQWCEDPEGSGFAELYCVAYVTAIADVLEANTVNGLAACVPNDAVVGDLVEPVKAYLREHPDRGGFGAAGTAGGFGTSGFAAGAVAGFGAGPSPAEHAAVNSSAPAASDAM